MAAPIALVDAFVTAKPWSGNPAGVCLLDHWPSEPWMQGLAAELNQAETAFLVPEGDSFGLRWFTPCLEVDLCGHATLAVAHWLWESGRLSPHRQAAFETKSGRLSATWASGKVVLDFPADVPTARDAGPVTAALGVVAEWTGASRMDWFVEVATEAEVKGAHPDLAAVAVAGMRGVALTSRSSRQGRDFVSRFFAPQSGIDEDPVTGSAHCALARYWSDKTGKGVVVGEQLSERGGIVECETMGDRVRLAGSARTVFTGSLLASPE